MGVWDVPALPSYYGSFRITLALSRARPMEFRANTRPTVAESAFVKGVTQTVLARAEMMSEALLTTAIGVMWLWSCKAVVCSDRTNISLFSEQGVSPALYKSDIIDRCTVKLMDLRILQVRLQTPKYKFGSLKVWVPSKVVNAGPQDPQISRSFPLHLSKLMDTYTIYLSGAATARLSSRESRDPRNLLLEFWNGVEEALS
ncbi:hypothetical protein BS47DRAFT_1384718 [Hydnum rufescens UP504]|uniref:Uncharacterized protein n=1 Tax=Hydnum rufescens UP504 TaxID=1448309 RepID=A0A9P6DRK6_9AGAM|nr:hypothetical protein BS47DRAFT_1384718 [Hydnum rufescens UP504]